MGKVVFLDPIDHVSGKLSRKHRTVYNHRRSSKLNFTSVRGERSTSPSAAEIQQRSKFSVVQRAVLQRSMNPAYMGQDQMAWAEAHGNGDKHTTFRGWLFSKAWGYYNSSTNSVDWPASGI